MKKLALLAIMISLILPWPVLAQGEYQAVLSPADISQFPRVSSYLNVHDPQGGFIHGLNPDSIQILEDGVGITPTVAQEIRIGVQISVVINAGPGFSTRNTKGVSRYDTLRQYLQAWAEDQKEINIDDLSLFTNSGINQTHLRDSQAWLTALATYQPDLKKAVPSLDPIGQAIQNAQDTQIDQPVNKAIFYITPLPGSEMTDAVLQDLISRANHADAHIFIWMLAGRNDFNSPAANPLRALADKTGGQFFAFSGNEAFPEAHSLLEPLRYLYKIEYKSKIQTGGKHNLGARITLQSDTVVTDPITYSINLQPVVPMFVGLPASIQRTAPASSKEPVKSLLPSSLTVEFLVQYPDSLQRDLASSKLLVDGTSVSENTSPPFTHFQWDLNSYTTSATHSLQIEVTDSFGMTSQSNSLPVEVDVVLPEKSSWQQFLAGNGVYMLLVGVFLLGMAVTLIVIRLRTGSPIGSIRSRGHMESAAAPGRALVVDSPADVATPGGWQAGLKAINADLDPLDEPPIRLSEKPLSWGRDQEQASIWTDDPAVDDLHCRLWWGDDHCYHLADNHSAAGTWVNFTEVDAEGRTLNHGDLIQIGNLFYKYEENPPRELRKIEVLSYNNVE
jgi:hypothetical protein